MTPTAVGIGGLSDQAKRFPLEPGTCRRWKCECKYFVRRVMKATQLNGPVHIQLRGPSQESKKAKWHL